MAGRKTFTIILPTYNEEEGIANMVTSLRAMYPDFRILIMDDNSTDRTKEIVDALEMDNVKFVVRDSDVRGVTASVCDGILMAGTDYFMCMDSDFQHPIEAAGRIYDELNKGYDLVIGVRVNRRALGFKRSMGSWAFHILATSVLFVHGKKKTKDIASGLFGGDVELFSKVINEEGSKFEMRGFKLLYDFLRNAPSDVNASEIKYEFSKRASGSSKVSPKVIYLSFHQCGVVGRFFAGIYKIIFYRQ
ncbi:MAG: glycosyltransferase [Candidatus Methanoplasma sp.]|jgi:dolichol-phosphate mannosyltransferase|nr:glycosyltransferase [Candidatus Methanoplasma sp.]